MTDLERLWRDSDAVLFDFDGVLADSEPYYRKSWNMVLSSYNHSIPEMAYWKHWSFLGEGLEGEMKRTGLEVSRPKREKERQKAIYREFCLSGMIPMFPLAAEALSSVMRKKPCAIASNTDSDLVKAVARSAVGSMPPVVGGDGLRSKPAPDIFLRAAETLGVQPDRCIVFEDAMKGILAGNSAGMRVVLVRNEYNLEFDGTGASSEINGLREIIETAGRC